MEAVSFVQPHSRALRIWHWSTFIVILLILYTVFTADFFINPRNMAPVVKESLQKQGVTLGDETVREVVSPLDAAVWEWHERFGYVLGILFAFRLVLELFQPKEERLLYRIKKAIALAKANRNRQPVHYLVVHLTYLLFYVLLTTIVATGLLLAFGEGKLGRDTMHSVKEIHEVCYYLVLLFTFIHISGVLLAERKGYRNIVSGMLHGKVD